MNLYIYRALDGEYVPQDATHVIVDEQVTIIKINAFHFCYLLVSVIMGDNVKRIEELAFHHCNALRFIRLSNTLECIEQSAFRYCESLEALFLPPTLKSIGWGAFTKCESLRMLILPNDINLDNVGNWIINYTEIQQIADNAGVAYGLMNESRQRQVHNWLMHQMDESPFHKLCYDSSITTRRINDYFNEHGNNSALEIDPIHGTTPLHMLTMNHHAPADSVASLLNSNMEAVFCLDNRQQTPLEYARECNVRGLVEMINGLCNRRNSSIFVRLGTSNERVTKRRRIE